MIDQHNVCLNTNLKIWNTCMGRRGINKTLSLQTSTAKKLGFSYNTVKTKFKGKNLPKKVHKILDGGVQSFMMSANWGKQVFLKPSLTENKDLLCTKCSNNCWICCTNWLLNYLTEAAEELCTSSTKRDSIKQRTNLCHPSGLITPRPDQLIAARRTTFPAGLPLPQWVRAPGHQTDLSKRHAPCQPVLQFWGGELRIRSNFFRIQIWIRIRGSVLKIRIWIWILSRYAFLLAFSYQMLTSYDKQLF